MVDQIKKIKELRKSLLNTRGLLDIDSKKLKIKNNKLKMNQPDFWKNQKNAVKISKEVEELEETVNNWEALFKEIKDLEELAIEVEKEKDEQMLNELDKMYVKLKKKFKKLEFFTLFIGKYDKNNAILSIHSGTGGVDAQDWAQILERMFLRFAEKMQWKTKIINRTTGSEAGIKNVVINIQGNWAYGYLRSENGVHRLVRISPFDAEQMRHTSFALVEVIPELHEQEKLEIKDYDLRIDVFKSSGPGGQGVNTTDSAVRITHKPTNISVSCQTERSQHQNKETALKILKSKLYKLEEEEREQKELKIRGTAQKAEWGKQIRSYVMQPYKMVKDHRTKYETQDIDNVLDGDLKMFAEEYLKHVERVTWNA
ncbi:peptide chain release factor 2 [Patescibacteria group bacterium]|nr:peptide chain release factor 2 [Patescibacteria group bacterium]